MGWDGMEWDGATHIKRVHAPLGPGLPYLDSRLDFPSRVYTRTRSLTHSRTHARTALFHMRQRV